MKRMFVLLFATGMLFASLAQAEYRQIDLTVFGMD